MTLEELVGILKVHEIVMLHDAKEVKGKMIAFNAQNV